MANYVASINIIYLTNIYIVSTISITMDSVFFTTNHTKTKKVGE